MSLSESIVEDAALNWFGGPDYGIGHGPNLHPRKTAGAGWHVHHCNERNGLWLTSI